MRCRRCPNPEKQLDLGLQAQTFGNGKNGRNSFIFLLNILNFSKAGNSRSEYNYQYDIDALIAC